MSQQTPLQFKALKFAPIFSCETLMPPATLEAMPKQRGRPPKPEAERKPTAAIRVHAHLAKMLNIISTATDEDTADIVSPMLEAGVRKLYDEVLRKLSQDSRADR